MLNLKSLITVLIPLLLVGSNDENKMFSRSVKVEYTMEVKPGEQINQLPPEIRQSILEKLKEPLYYILETNGSESLYYLVKKKSKTDTVENTIAENNIQKKTVTVKESTTANSASFYKDFENKTILSRSLVNQKAYITRSDLKENHWKIQPETANIAGMNCRKAILGEIEAWFTPDIPVSDGPFSYYGLPGLVITIESPKEKIYATRISYPTGLKIEKPQGELITHEELKRIRTEAGKDVNSIEKEGNKTTTHSRKTIKLN